MEAVSSKSWLGLHSPRVSLFPSRKQSLSIGKVGFCIRKRNNNCLRLRIGFGIGSTSKGRSIQGFNARLVRAEASAELGDDDEINVGPQSQPQVLPCIVGVGGAMAVLFFGARAVGYVLSQRITTAGVAARALVVAANIIGTTVAYSLLDKLGRKGFSGMTKKFASPTNGRSLLSNVMTSDDVDTYARVISLKAAGIPFQQAQVLAEEMKDLPKSKFDSLVENIRLDQQHEKETEALRVKKMETLLDMICYGSMIGIFVVISLSYIFFWLFCGDYYI